jgi:hypothetical protein
MYHHYNHHYDIIKAIKKPCLLVFRASPWGFYPGEFLFITKNVIMDNEKCLDNFGKYQKVSYLYCNFN